MNVNTILLSNSPDRSNGGRLRTPTVKPHCSLIQVQTLNIVLDFYLVLGLVLGNKQRDQEMAATFLVAINCWDFLQSNVTYRGGILIHIPLCACTSLLLPLSLSRSLPSRYLSPSPLEFSRLCQQWGAFEWDWLNSFRADMALYKVNFLTMQV